MCRNIQIGQECLGIWCILVHVVGFQKVRRVEDLLVF